MRGQERGGGIFLEGQQHGNTKCEPREAWEKETQAQTQQQAPSRQMSRELLEKQMEGL